MLFNSYVFIFVFLPLVLVAWWGLAGEQKRLAALTIGSYVFYAWWNWRFLPLMIGSTTVDYIAGKQIANSDDHAARKRWLIASLGFNLAALAVFKYFGFFTSSANAVAAAAGMKPLLPVINVVLPIGISFYTF